MRKLRAEIAGLSVKRRVAEGSEVMSGGVEGNESSDTHQADLAPQKADHH